MLIVRMLATLALLVAALAPAAAQDWPNRPVTLVVPFAPGSGSDVLARVLSPRLGENLGATIVIENVGGAGGMSGAARVAKAAPDGYQLLLASLGTYALNQTLYKKPLYNSVTDFTPVGLLAGTPILLVTRKDLPVANLREFIAYAKASQGKLQYGSPGVGSASHLACALFNATIGVEVTHVPYRSTGQAMADLIPGRIDYECVPIAATVAQIEGGLVKAIAILAKDRSAILPTLASAQEQGLADFDVDTWYAIALPKGAPAPIVRKLNAAMSAALDDADVQAKLKDIGVAVAARERRSPEYLADFAQREIEKWAGPIKAAGISID
jgi:tripartite-type tricarboxylate transporter receptor subunit TctC